MRATLVVGGFLAKVARLTPVRVVSLLAAMLGAVVALGLLLAIPAVAMAADINKTVSVDATQEGWQDTGIFLGAGDHVVIDGSGTVDLDKFTANFDNTPPDGIDQTADDAFPLPGAKIGALIGKIDNGDPFLVGDLLTIASGPSKGELYLAVNDSFGGFADNSGQFNADIAVDLAPPLEGTNPAAGATGVDPTAKIRVKFSEPMKDRTINPNNIKIYEGCTNTIVPAKVDYVDEITPVRAVLKPLAPLALNTTYRVEVEGADAPDGKGVKDATGTPMAETYIFRFTTGDTLDLSCQT
jgi:Bacterial Ig-like domain/PA-IL-like protein